MSRTKVVCWGASGHALAVTNALRLCPEVEMVGYLDDVNPDRRGQMFEGREILGGSEQLDSLLKQGVKYCVLGFGHCDRRIAVSRRLAQKGYRLFSVIHPEACIASDVTIGDGTVVLADAVIGPGCVIDENVIVNNGAIISHECVIGEGVHVCPGVNIAGKARIGRACWIGIGSTIIDKVTIGDHVFIGAGAVVTKDIPSGYIAYGNPAKIIRKADEKF